MPASGACGVGFDTGEKALWPKVAVVEQPLQATTLAIGRNPGDVVILGLDPSIHAVTSAIGATVQNSVTAATP